jgi:hypothetical protein
MSANQNATRETAALVKYGMRQLEEVFKQTLMNTGAAKPIEPVFYFAKGKTTAMDAFTCVDEQTLTTIQASCFQ